MAQKKAEFPLGELLENTTNEGYFVRLAMPLDGRDPNAVLRKERKDACRLASEHSRLMPHLYVFVCDGYGYEIAAYRNGRRVEVFQKDLFGGVVEDEQELVDYGSLYWTRLQSAYMAWCAQHRKTDVSEPNPYEAHLEHLAEHLSQKNFQCLKYQHLQKPQYKHREVPVPDDIVYCPRHFQRRVRLGYFETGRYLQQKMQQRPLEQGTMLNP
ncbi:hypothetical protein [Alicyclobacillus sp. SP_1]|jgi:hypothetical protein|uniref:hypothetical protein n=1 Tax=Alicyclobacillus sp. SP_1 TaxID=2942475 RepID=UPI002156F9CF|nr:hypothetical protein [Alicyclobacillus sp. SP_1]